MANNKISGAESRGGWRTLVRLPHWKGVFSGNPVKTGFQINGLCQRHNRGRKAVDECQEVFDGAINLIPLLTNS